MGRGENRKDRRISLQGICRDHDFQAPDHDLVPLRVTGSRKQMAIAMTIPRHGNNLAVSGVVLAGGLSRRLGRDKAVEPLRGQPLIRRVIQRVGKVSDEIIVVVAEQKGEMPCP